MKRRTRLPFADPSQNARRRFLKTAASAGAAVSAGAVLGKTRKAHASCFAERTPIAELSELSEGAVLDFTYPTESDAAFLTQLRVEAFRGVGANRNIVAFLRACPHMGCRIENVEVEDAVLGPCGCHRSRFDLARGGMQIIGRATQELVQVILELEGETIYATGVVGLPYGHALEL